MKRKPWNKDEVRMLKHLFPIRHTSELAGIFHRSHQAISNKALKLGLKKEPYIKRKAGFQAGYKPFNKGRKMEEWLSPEVHQKIKANQARTADRNRAAALLDGSRRRRFNGEHIKVDGEWIRMSHYVWIRENGPIPEGMAVFFRDGNFDNFAIENLYLGPKNYAPFILAQKTPDERARIHAQSGSTRKMRNLERFVELDRILAEISKSNNDIYYVPTI